MKFSSALVASLSISSITNAEQVRRLRNGERDILGPGGSELPAHADNTVVGPITPEVVRRAKAEKEMSLDMTSSIGCMPKSDKIPLAGSIILGAPPGSGGSMRTSEAKAEKTLADTGSMRGVDAKAGKLSAGSLPGPAPKTEKSILAAGASMPTEAKAGKTGADGGSMRAVDAKAEKKHPGSVPPYHIFVTKTDKKGDEKSMKLVESTKAQKIPPGSMLASEGGSMKLTETGSKPATVAKEDVASDTAFEELHEGEKLSETTLEQGTTTTTTATESTTTSTTSTTTTTTTTTTTIPPCTSAECMDCVSVSTPPTLDGGTFDWLDVAPFETPMYFAMSRAEYPYGNLVMKCVHDTQRIYFLFEVPGPFRFDPDNNHRCASVSTMFKMGEDAQYYNMGNCPFAATSCAANPSDCTDYKVDIGGHWEMRKSQMGVKYGINQSSGTGNISDEFAFSPYCHGDDNDSLAGMEWEGIWIHTSPMEGNDGTYIFEMSRSLKTASTLTDAQLEVGEAIDFGFAYWDPYELSNGWTHEGHYVTGGTVNWISLRLLA